MRQKGITLISLIITVVILILLAGITFNLTLGEKAIFKTASKSTEEYRKQTATEKINLKITNSQIQKYASEQRMPTLQELANDFCVDHEIEYVASTSKKLASLGTVDLTNKTSFFTKLTDFPYEFEINSSLQLASIDGVKVATNETDNSNVNAKLEELEKMVKSLSEVVNIQNEKISKLENETIFNKRIKLLDAPIEIPITITSTNLNIDVKLNDSIENYKYLEIQADLHWTPGTGNHLENTIIIAVEQLKYNNSNTVNWENESVFNITLLWPHNNAYASTSSWFKDSSTLCTGQFTFTSRTDWDKLRIINIYGIK